MTNLITLTLDLDEVAVVPRGATPEMLAAYERLLTEKDNFRWRGPNVTWEAMLSAAPPLQGDGLEWRKDCFGNERRALYIGGICVGHIAPLRPQGPWRAWLQTDEDGDRVGKDQWPSDDAAREALYDAATCALKASPPKGGA